MSRPSYLFLVGLGRSGTTVLRKSLGLHPSIYYGGKEDHIITDFLRVQFDTFTNPDHVSKLLVTREQFDRALERMLNELLWHDPERIAQCIRMASLTISPKLIPYLMQVFPNARVLQLVRNGIQVVSSRQLFGGFDHAPFERQCMHWARTREIDEWGSAQGSAYHLFRYEWFNDEARLRAELDCVYDWLEIPRDDAPLQNMLTTRYHPTYHPDETNAVDAARAQNSAEGRAQLDQIRGERWQFWTRAQRAEFEKTCGGAMQYFGYAIPWHDDASVMAVQRAQLARRVRKAIDKTRNIVTINKRWLSRTLPLNRR